MSYFPTGATPQIAIATPALNMVDVAKPSERVTATRPTEPCPAGTGTGYVLDRGAWRRARCGEVGQPVASHTLDWRDAKPATPAGAAGGFPWVLAAAAGGAILVVVLLRRRRKETV